MSSRVRISGDGNAEWGIDGAVFGADSKQETVASGDVDHSWAFLPVGVSCVAQCPAVKCSCPLVECTCACDTPEPRLVQVFEHQGWQDLFVQSVVVFSWLFWVILFGLCGRCASRHSSVPLAAIVPLAFYQFEQVGTSCEETNIKKQSNQKPNKKLGKLKPVKTWSGSAFLWRVFRCGGIYELVLVL